MTVKEIKNIRDELHGYLKERRLHDVFVRLLNIAEAMLLWDIADRTRRLEETYAYMLKYLTEGVSDPSREKVLRDIVTDLYRLVDEFEIEMMSKDTPTLFFNIRRYQNLSALSLKGIIDKYLSALADSREIGTSIRASIEESIVNDLFNCVWTTFPLSKSDSDELRNFLTNPLISSEIYCVVLSALGLGSLEYFDKEKLEILIETYAEYSASDLPDGDNISIVALSGIVFNLLKYKDRILPLSTINRLDLIRESKNWHSDLESIVLEMIRAKDTERINRTMREEIIPGMMAMRPEIEKKIKDGDIPLEEFDGMQMNPEWEEMLRKSGIGDKLKELNELQMEGSDVFMSTFSHLKNYPFFNNVSAWFLPFDSNVTSVKNVLSKHPELSDITILIETLPFLCDSDKYSMLFSVEMVPEQQRNLMLGQIKTQREQMAEMIANSTNLTDPVRRRNAIRTYLQNVYRFYNLFRRKSEFYNVFENSSDLLLVDTLRNDIRRPEVLNLVSEFYFKRQYWNDALLAFDLLDEMNEISSTMFQKMGYCLEKSGDITRAIKAYEQADLLDNSSIWLKKRLAKSYRLAGRLDDAINIYRDLSKLDPESTSVAISLGYTLIQAERFSEAIKEFYKVEFLDSDSRKAMRPLAWSLFMIRDFKKAETYYNKILLDNPRAEDYHNMGHVALALGKFKDAINYYKLSVINGNGETDDFFKALETDRQALLNVGFEASTISLVADAVLYTLQP